MRSSVVEIDPIVLDTYIADRAEVAFDFLERIVAIPSTLGREQEAQEVVAAELERLGFQVERLAIAEAIAGDPHAGVPQVSYDGRYDLLAWRGGPGPVLQLNGHVDVVPAEEAELWPSSVPSVARLGVRFGFPRQWTAARAEARLREVVASAARSDPWLAEHPPEMRCTGFRAEGYALPADHPLAVAVADAHEQVNGSRPRAVVLGSTSDEAVELASIVDGARVLARLLAAWPLGGFDGRR
jgi:acetylornithine deacetylase/succinyl-diaminopimelate desuccinylase-like protein